MIACAMITGLRALLIQKDVKHELKDDMERWCLRALLIQKDVKQPVLIHIVQGV